MAEIKKTDLVASLSGTAIIGRALLVDTGILANDYFVVGDYNGMALMPSRSAGVKLRPARIDLLGSIRVNKSKADELAKLWNSKNPTQPVQSLPWREFVGARVVAIEAQIEFLTSKAA